MLRIQGYRDLNRVRPRVRKIAAEMVEIAQAVIRPQACYRRLAVRERNGARLRLETGPELECEAFAKFLPGCDEVNVFVLTIGPDFDRTVDELQADDKLVEALFLENAGWLAVEATSKQFADALRQQAKSRGRKLTRRLSPGYTFKVAGTATEWSLYEQSKLFELFEQADLPVTLLESCAMLPRMSRSGIFGLRPTGGQCPTPQTRSRLRGKSEPLSKS